MALLSFLAGFIFGIFIVARSLAALIRYLVRVIFSRNVDRPIGPRVPPLGSAPKLVFVAAGKWLAVAGLFFVLGVVGGPLRDSTSLGIAGLLIDGSLFLAAGISGYEALFIICRLVWRPRKSGENASLVKPSPSSRRARHEDSTNESLERLSEGGWVLYDRQ